MSYKAGKSKGGRSTRFHLPRRWILAGRGYSPSALPPISPPPHTPIAQIGNVRGWEKNTEKWSSMKGWGIIVKHNLLSNPMSQINYKNQYTSYCCMHGITRIANCIAQHTALMCQQLQLLTVEMLDLKREYPRTCQSSLPELLLLLSVFIPMPLYLECPLTPTPSRPGPHHVEWSLHSREGHHPVDSAQ